MQQVVLAFGLNKMWVMTRAKLAADGVLRRQLADAGVRRVRDQFTLESTTSALLNEIS